MTYKVIDLATEDNSFVVTEQEFDVFWKEFEAYATRNAQNNHKPNSADLQKRAAFIKARGYFYVSPKYFEIFKQRSLGYKIEKGLDELLKG